MALVPARLLADMVKSFEPAPVEFEATGGQATIVCSNYEGTVRCLPAEDFPILQEPTGTRVTVAGAALSEGIAQVARAASRDEARPILTGVLLEVNREGLTMVATDSYRLAMRELTATAEGEAKALVPERALAEAGRAAGAEDKAEASSCSSTEPGAFRIGTLDPDVPADRRRVPQLPPAPARELREPAGRRPASSSWTRCGGSASWPGRTPR